MAKGKNVYFISDLHLGASYFADPIAKERRVVRWLDTVKDDATEIYLLGDILDYWYEYRYVAPRGFTRFFGKIAELSDSGVRITWFIGNHDIWIFDYLPNELGVEVVDGVVEKEIMGKRFYMAHGDGVGRHQFSFRLIRSIFRNRFCQFLYSAIHPRWTVAFAHRWSRSSRMSHDDGGPVEARVLAARDTIYGFTERYAEAHPEIDYFVYGHLHLVDDKPVGASARMIILGDWITHDSYACFDGENLTLHRFPGE